MTVEWRGERREVIHHQIGDEVENDAVVTGDRCKCQAKCKAKRIIQWPSNVSKKHKTFSIGQFPVDRYYTLHSSWKSGYVSQ